MECKIMVYINEEAKEVIVSFLNNAKESINNVSVIPSSDYILYLIELSKYFKTDELSKCQIVHGGSSSWIVSSISASHDEEKIENSKSVSMKINIRVNLPSLNNYEYEIMKYIESLKASQSKKNE
jgi:hypothetical protein